MDQTTVVARGRILRLFVLLLFLIFHELGKFLLEFLRFPRLPALQAPSVAVGIGAAVIYVIVALRRRPTLETDAT